MISGRKSRTTLIPTCRSIPTTLSRNCCNWSGKKRERAAACDQSEALIDRQTLISILNPPPIPYLILIKTKKIRHWLIAAVPGQLAAMCSPCWLLMLHTLIFPCCAGYSGSSLCKRNYWVLCYWRSRAVTRWRPATVETPQAFSIPWAAGEDCWLLALKR